jgi:hypothetical protein
MSVGKPDDDHLLPVSQRARDGNRVTRSNLTMRFGDVTVDVDLSALAGFLRFRAGSEQTRHVQPDIESERVGSFSTIHAGSP